MESMGKTVAFAAVSGLCAGLYGCDDKAGDKAEGDTKANTSAMPSGEAANTDKNCCRGKNDCKGKGGCKTDGNECKSKNDCKGKGGCNMRDCT